MVGGYELTASPLIDTVRGTPLAPMELQLWAADGVHTTRHEGLAERVGHLEQVLPTMQASRTWGLALRDRSPGLTSWAKFSRPCGLNAPRDLVLRTTCGAPSRKLRCMRALG